MKLVYNNIIEPKYQYHTDSGEYDTTIGSPTVPTTDLTPITLYDSDSSEDKSPIYIDFAKADTLDQIITFCDKYGAIINFKLVPKNDNEYHNYQTLQIFEYYNDLYDCISYKHFTYYQLQMKYLIEIHRLMLKYNSLTDKSYTNSKDIDSTLKDLLLNCLALIQNPFFSVMYELEYADTIDHEKYRTYFSKYQFIDYIYRLNISKSKHITSQTDDITDIKSTTNVINNSDIETNTNSDIQKDDNINTTADNNAESKTDNNSNSITDNKTDSITDIKADFYSDLITNNGTPTPNADVISFLSRTISNPLTDNDFCHSFFISHQKVIISLAQCIFSDVLSFEIREIYPKITLKDSEIISDWEFPTLVSAMFFYFYLDYSNSKVITRCANKKCNMLFAHSGAYTKRKYCCHECAHKVANRKYKQKITHENF